MPGDNWGGGRVEWDEPHNAQRITLPRRVVRVFGAPGVHLNHKHVLVQIESTEGGGITLLLNFLYVCFLIC